MIENINKSELILETSGVISNFKSLDLDNTLSSKTSLNFEGFAGFNSNYAAPILKLLAQSKPTTIYNSYVITGNLHNDSSMHTADFHIIKNCRDTAFLFKTLRNLSITLPDLRIGYEYKTSKHAVLYLDRKILRVLNTLEDQPKKEILFYFYCLARFFSVVSKYDLNLHLIEGYCVVHEENLKKAIEEYNIKDSEFTLECIQLKEDVVFKNVTYNNLSYAPLCKDNIDVKFTSTLVYNIIKTKDSEKLCIINTTTKEYYIINLNDGAVYTNNELKEYNVFEYTEWIPYLIINMHKVKPQLSTFTITNLPLEQLLSTKEKEVYIVNDANEFESFLEHYPTVSENTNMDLYKGFFKDSTLKFEGGVLNLRQQYEDDKYAQQLYAQEQSYYESFDLKDLAGIVKGVAKGDIYSIFFEGESGTGKSTAARVIASKCGLPLVAINCSTNIEESDIIGAMIPNPNKASADDPEFIWQDGQLTKAVRYGYGCSIEELGFARPGVLGKLNSLLDESRQIDLPNGEIVKAHPNFRLFASTNIGYEGTNRLNKALVNRFEICKKFEDLDEKELKDIIIKRTGYDNTAKIDQILEVYRAIKRYGNENNLNLVVSIRQLLTIFRQGKYYRNAKEALNNLLLNQAFLEEPEHLEHFKEVVLQAFTLSFKI